MGSKVFADLSYSRAVVVPNPHEYQGSAVI